MANDSLLLAGLPVGTSPELMQVLTPLWITINNMMQQMIAQNNIDAAAYTGTITLSGGVILTFKNGILVRAV